jgi:small subunit ribosomal protein S1
MITDVNTRPERFEHLLSEYEYERPKKGQFLDGEVIRIEDEAIFVDVGTKRTAVVSRKDINNLDEEWLANLEKGDQLPVYVVNTPSGEGDLFVSISKGLEQKDWKLAERYFSSGETLDLEVVDMNRGGLVVEFGNINGFVPNSHIPALQNVENRERVKARKTEAIGSQLPLKVIEVDCDRKRLILSAKDAQKEIRLRRLLELKSGDVIKGCVVNIVNYGAFVDLNGITGLIHISELSWHHIKHPSEVLDSGEEIEVMVKNVDLDRERISLSHRALLPNPWDAIEERYSNGDLVEGLVTSIKDYGAFVKLPIGIEGLLHVSEMNGTPEDLLTFGEKILVRIVAIDSHRERINLSLNRVSPEDHTAWLMQNEEKI